MKLKNLWILLLLSTNMVFAQDTLYRTDGSVKLVKIMEINENQIRYKLFANQDGPAYTVKKDEVAKIAFQNGMQDVFQKRSLVRISDGSASNPRSTDFNCNFISVNVPDFFLGFITLSYEHTFKSGDFSYKIPLSVGLVAVGLDSYVPDESMRRAQGYYRRNKKFSTGFDFYVYPFGQGKSKYFVGPSVEIGTFTYNDDGWANGQVDYLLPGRENKTGTFNAIILQNGFLFQPTKSINFSVNMGIGYSQQRFMHYDEFTQKDFKTIEDFVAFRAGFNVGYKF